eukprot:CAMPEP_0117426676 /NCGR_PEP_ID=MMETSP0758-20121206/6722_1 /TAXON_ID=63605 /ORGANISM="Percolomonas cosmopolitus, Strain AE-1 (ATCC 50343)" /LENGTH=781 /DNA_ID=CAMNT_0005211947 /DNA_START=405 /DNA_END=2748 /DNA_ORIENTATION=+
MDIDAEREKFSAPNITKKHKGEFSLSKDIFNNLYSYQRDGVYWLWKRHANDGCILGDDMGLGKTIQIIAFLRGLYENEQALYSLVLAPVSVLRSWERELKKWAPNLNTFYFHDLSKKERKHTLTRFRYKGGILISSYGMVTHNVALLEEFTGFKEIQQFDYIILDEGHKIKNSKIQLSVNLRKIPSLHRLILTGTPVQNNLMELWSIMDYIFNGKLLGDRKSFDEYYNRVICRGNEKEASNFEKRRGIQVAEKLQKMINPYFLRRTKKEVLHEEAVDSNEKMEDESKMVFDIDEETYSTREKRVIEGIQKEEVKDQRSISKKFDLVCWIQNTSYQIECYRQMLDSVHQAESTAKVRLGAITRLKQICSHPMLVDEHFEGFLQTIDLETLEAQSGKVTILMKLLHKLHEEQSRVLIFSQSIKTLNIIERLMDARNYNKRRIDGKTTHRQVIIDEFNRDSSIFAMLLTTKTAAFGITLTGANRVIIFDPSWNPAVDNQAVDRAYRIGQSENVVIFRFISCGTVEEKIYRKQVFKDGLFRSVSQVNAANQARYFTKAQLKQLFAFEDQSRSKTQEEFSQLHAKLEQKYREEELVHLLIQELNGWDHLYGVSYHDLLYKIPPELLHALTAEESQLLNDNQFISRPSNNHRPINVVRKKGFAVSVSDLSSKPHFMAYDDFQKTLPIQATQQRQMIQSNLTPIQPSPPMQALQQQTPYHSLKEQRQSMESHARLAFLNEQEEEAPIKDDSQVIVIDDDDDDDLMVDSPTVAPAITRVQDLDVDEPTF